jgi:glycerol-3-phosphate dehydrogenase
MASSRGVTFSAVDLARDVPLLKEPFDLAIIGGGITGIQLAREAAGRGLKTVLFERHDFGAGTSAATSKLIHGGIRYLEQHQFGVVRESLRERRILALSAPHLVEQRRFVMPAWRWSKPPTALLGAGVGLYSLLGADSNRGAPASLRIPAPRWLSRSQVRAAIPWIDPDGLQGGFAYHDTLNIHPERLLLAYARSAAADGALLMNYMEVTGFLRDGPTVQGVTVTDHVDGASITVKAATVVNAAGPWLDLVLGSSGPSAAFSLIRSKGVHVLTPPVGGSPQVTDTVFARTRNGRHVIVTPWQHMSFIGPTDTSMSEHPDDVAATSSDVDEILGTVNDTLAPGVPKLRSQEVIDTTVGIRPLVVPRSSDSSATAGADTYSASRRHEIYDHALNGVANLWSIGGGKWTTGRATAVAMVETLLASPALRPVVNGQGSNTRQRLGFRSDRCAVWGAFEWAQDAEPYLRAAALQHPELDLEPEVRIHLARLYGTEHERILDLVSEYPGLGHRISMRSGRYDIAAQALFGIKAEGALSLSDLLDRRLVIGTLGPVTAGEILGVAQVAAPLWGWDTERVASEVEREVTRRAFRRDRWQQRPN